MKIESSPNLIMSGWKVPMKRRHESSTPSITKETKSSTHNNGSVGLAAICSTKNQEEVEAFIQYILETVQKNSSWVNKMIDSSFQCALLLGAGPNTFELQEIIYPNPTNQVKLEIEVRDADGYDKVAVAALVKMSNRELINLLDFMKYRLGEHKKLKADFIRGNAMGIYFAVLKPINDVTFRITERIVIENDTVAKKRVEKILQAKASPKKVRKETQDEF